MKKKLLLLVMVLLPIVASANSVEINGIYYNLNSDGNVAEVTSNPYKYTGRVAIPESVNYNNVIYSVTSIGDKAFEKCSDLTSITIPNSVTSIGQSAFSGCYGLTSITIPKNVTSIGQGAFSSNNNLISIKVESGNITYDSRNNCNAIIETVNNELLCGCKNTVIPNSVTSIGDLAFSGCSGLTSITIPNSVTSIGDMAFSGCSGLTSITIPNSVTSIGYGAFTACSKLAFVTIPNSVTSISPSAFQYCDNITSLNISCEVIDPWFCSRTSLTEITLGKGVKIVKENAFKGCTNIKTINIGSTVTSIEARAFSRTDKLTDVICKATTVPETDKTAFEYSYPNYAKLHVPAVSQATYKETAPWSEFKEIVPIIQDLPDDAEQCATPTISYQKGKLSFACITEGVEYQYQITDNDIKIGAGAEISLDATYHISVYATKNGYKDSKISTATLCWIDKNPTTEGITDNVANISANAVLIQNVGGMLSVTGVPAGTAINVYDLSGKKTGSAKASSETTNIATTLRSGEVGILKIGDKSIKYLVH